MQPLFHFWNAPESLGPGYFFFNFLIWLSNVLSFCFKICYGFFSCSVIKRSNEPPGLFINTRQQKLPQTRSSTFSLGWIKRKISEELQVFDSLAADFDCFFFLIAGTWKAAWRTIKLTPSFKTSTRPWWASTRSCTSLWNPWTRPSGISTTDSWGRKRRIRKVNLLWFILKTGKTKRKKNKNSLWRHRQHLAMEFLVLPWCKGRRTGNSRCKTHWPLLPSWNLAKRATI